jgi:anaerobic selenocysteine-containing dehydrogenase
MWRRRSVSVRRLVAAMMRSRRCRRFRLPLGPTERVWLAKSRKAEFIPFTGLEEDAALTGADILKLTTLRSHDQYNTTVYGLDDRYRGVFGRRDVLFINEQDLAAQNLAHGDVVEVASAVPGQEHKLIRLTAIAHDISRGRSAPITRRRTTSAR